MYENSSMVGNIGESVAICEFTKRNIPVLIPFGQNLPYDLIIQIKNKFYRIQCKTTKNTINGEKMVFKTCRTNGFTHEYKIYNENEIDFYFLYCIENNYIALVPITENIGAEFTIRLSLARNNQQKDIHMFYDYSLDKQLEKLYNKPENIIHPFIFI